MDCRDFCLTAFFFHKHPGNGLGLDSLAVQKLDQSFRSDLADIVITVRQRCNAAGGEAAVETVVKTDDSDLLGDMDVSGSKIFGQGVCHLVIIAYNCGTAPESRGDQKIPQGTVRFHNILIFRTVPEDLLVIHRKIQIPQGINEACIALMTLQVVIFK